METKILMLKWHSLRAHKKSFGKKCIHAFTVGVSNFGIEKVSPL